MLLIVWRTVIAKLFTSEHDVSLIHEGVKGNFIITQSIKWDLSDEAFWMGLHCLLLPICRMIWEIPGEAKVDLMQKKWFVF